MFLIYIFLHLFASYVATFSIWVSFAQRKCATGTKNMHMIRIFGYYNTDDLRKAAFLCGCVPAFLCVNGLAHATNRAITLITCSFLFKVAVTCINRKKYPFYKILLLRAYKSNRLIRHITLQSIEYTLNVPSITAMHSSNAQPKRFISAHA